MLIALKVLVVLAVLILIIGLIRPKWVLFWMKEPDRLSITALAMALFMGGWTGIAKMTMKPKEVNHGEQSQQHNPDESNQLNLNRDSRSLSCKSSSQAWSLKMREIS
jgi:hypothetical protein